MPDETVTEVQGNFTDIMVISELRGSYPNVPISPDVDYAALIAGDSDPQFITLPIGKANVKSGNGRYYDDAWLTELMRQTLESKPVGLMGHMTEQERATSFKPEAVHWVGAMRDGDGTLWGKAYVVPGEARERVRRYKASGKSIATSIDAYAQGKWDEAMGAYRMDSKTLKLSQIDLAPSDRAGIADLARVPMLTSEMQDEPAQAPEMEPQMDKYEIIREMTPEDVKLLPDSVIEAIQAKVPQPETPAEVQLVTELREALGVDESADLTKIITELRQAEQARQAEAVSRRISELAADPEKGVKLESVRGLVTELVAARNPQTVEEAETAYQSVIEMESVKAALGAQVQATMGPPQRQPTPPRDGQKKYFAIPEKQPA